MKLSNQAKIFKALSNEQRLKIFLMLYNQCCAPKEMPSGPKSKAISGSCCPIKGALEMAFTKACDCVDISRSTISHHFKELQHAGLITCERMGRAFRCRINKEAVNSIKELLK